MFLTMLKLKQTAGEVFRAEVKISSRSLARAAYILLPIIVVAYLAYGLFFVPAIFMDDWTSVIERIVTDNAQWLDLAQSRPLLFSTFLIQHRLLGLHITGYYIVLWSLYVLMAILLYKIVSRFPLAQRQAFGLVVALLFLVYPTNYTHMWLIQLGIYCAIVLTLLYGYLILRFAEGSGWATMMLASICLLVSLGLYEAQAGVAVAWALTLIVIFRQTTVKRRLALLLPIVLVGFFSLWRTVGYQAVGVNDQYLSEIVTAPGALLSRLLSGYKVSLGWGWTYPVEQFLPWLSGAKLVAFVLLIVILALWWIVRWIGPRTVTNEQQGEITGLSLDDRRSMIGPYLFAAILGVVLVGAGYVPVLTVFLPSLSGIGSRFNQFATIGGAVFFASLMMMGSLLLAKNRQQIKILFFVSAAPLIVLAIATQASVQYHNRVAWREQQTIWQQLFSAAPNFKDDTRVLFILPGYQDRTGYYNWQRTPLSASWEVSSGVRLLYNNPTLSGDVYFPDVEEPIEPILTDEGVLSQDTGTLTPYDQVVAYVYDNDAGTLIQLDELSVELVQELAGPTKLCTDCVASEKVVDAPFRRLVRD